MEKYLKIPVTDEAKQIVSINNVKLVEQASTTTVTLAYGSGKVVTITHAAIGASSEKMRDEVQTAIVKALETGWTSVVYDYIPSSAVSNIDIA